MKRRGLGALVLATALWPTVANAEPAHYFDIDPPFVFDIPAQKTLTGTVDIDIPILLRDGSAHVETSRARSPRGEELRSAFTFELDAANGKLRARVDLDKIAIAGNYAVRLKARGTAADAGVDEQDLTFVRAAPQIAISAIRLDCVGITSKCSPDPDHITITELSGSAGATNLRLLFADGLRGPDATSASAKLSIDAVKALPASEQIDRPITIDGKLDFGTTSGQARLVSAQGVEVAVPIEIHKRLGWPALAILLLGGLALSYFARRVLVVREELLAAKLAAATVLESLRALAADQPDEDTRKKIEKIAADLDRAIARASAVDDVKKAADDAKAKCERLHADATAACQAAANRAMAMRTALTGPRLPKAMEDVVQTARTRLDDALADVDAGRFSSVGKELDAIDQTLTNLAADAKKLEADLPQWLDIGAWELAELKRVRAQIEKQRAAIRDAKTALDAVAATFALADTLRYGWLVTGVGEIVSAVDDVTTRLRAAVATTDLERLRTQAVALQHASAPGIDALAEVGDRIRELRADLSSTIAKASGDPIPKAVDDDLAAGRFGTAAEHAAEAFAEQKRNQLLGPSLGAVPSVANFVAALPRAPRVEHTAVSAPTPRRAAPRAARASVPALQASLRQTRAYSDAVAIAITFFVGFWAFVDSFVGTPKDILMVLGWSLGTNIGLAKVLDIVKSPPKLG